MTFIAPPNPVPRPPVDDEAALAAFVDDMVGVAIRTQLWLLYLDAEDRPIPLAMPLEDVRLPVGEAETDHLADLALEAARMVGGTQVVLVWERAGGPGLTIGERASVARVAERFPGGDVVLRGQYLSHSSGVVAL